MGNKPSTNPKSEDYLRIDVLIKRLSSEHHTSRYYLHKSMIWYAANHKLSKIPSASFFEDVVELDKTFSKVSDLIQQIDREPHLDDYLKAHNYKTILAQYDSCIQLRTFLERIEYPGRSDLLCTRVEY